MEKQTQNIYNLIILDESGSMNVVKKQTIQGFNELASKLAETQKMFLHQNHFVSLITFNSSGIKNKLFNQPIGELSKLTESSFNPDGNTPLYDAICKSVLKLKHELYLENNYNVLVTIITDGEENSSLEFNLKETKVLIENLSENQNWAFGLIGANINVKTLAESLSIPITRTISFETNDSSVKDMFERYGKAQEKLSYLINEEYTCHDLEF